MISDGTEFRKAGVDIIQVNIMGRDIQKILLHWGGWAAGEHCAGMGWARVSSGFRELAQSNSRQRVSCSDEDGRIIDRCVSVLGTAGLERERECIMDYYVKGMSKRAIGRKFKVREDEIRKQVQIAESFIYGCLEALDVQLDMDMVYKACPDIRSTLVRPQTAC